MKLVLAVDVEASRRVGLTTMTREERDALTVALGEMEKGLAEGKRLLERPHDEDEYLPRRENRQVGAMTLTDLDALDFPGLWARLSAERQAAIGIAAIAEQLAGLVAADDGTDTTAADRNIALEMASEAYEGVADATEQAFPEIEWWTD